MLISIRPARVSPLLRAFPLFSGEIHGHRSPNQRQSSKRPEFHRPTPESGKARVSLNAVKTGLTARIMLFSAEDAPIYQKHLDRFFSKYSPASDDEHDLVQTIVDTEWRLRQIAPLEAGIYLHRPRKMRPPRRPHPRPRPTRRRPPRRQIYLTYKKNLATIALQERRLTNQLDKAVAKLEALQKERKDARLKELDRAEKSIKACALNNLHPDFEYFGFDFSIEEFETCSARSKTFTLTGGKSINFDQFLTEFRAQAAERKAVEAQAAA